MMKLFGRVALSTILILNASIGFTAAGGGGGGGSNAGGQGGGNISDLINYFLNFGGYLGYNLQKDPTDSGKKQITNELLYPTPAQGNTESVPIVQLINKVVLANFLGGSFIVNTVPSIAQIISDAAGNAYPEFVNQYASFSFNPQGLLSASSGGGSYANQNGTGPSVSPLIDQPPYQADPVAQQLLNILGTPDYSYCMDNAEKNFTCDYSGSGSRGSKSLMTEYQVMANTIGTPLPGTDDYYSTNLIQPLLGDLNVNTLITPMMYSQTSFQQQNNQNNSNGLKARTQIQQAGNFIRYASGAVAPLVMPDRALYDSWVTKAKQPTSVAQQQAQAVIASYLASLRVYAAQLSVGVSNLYFIMSKRLPQGKSGEAQSSQALSEFNMATRRLFNPNQSGDETQWVSQINKASAVTVQKEMAILLAEINYQLYLNRQQEERILLTNTLLLLQNSKASQPNNQLNPPSTGVRGTQGNF